MQPHDQPSGGREPLGRFWDALVAGETPSDEGLPPESTETVRILHELDDVPGPDPRLVARMWTETLRRAGSEVQAPSAPVPWTIALARRVTAMIETTQSGMRELTAAVLAGAVAGALVIGLGLRLAMRIAGMLTESNERDRLTEAGNRVGELSVGGTLFLMTMGAVLGIAGAIAYVIVKPWFPWSGWRRGLVFGSALFALGGSSIFENGRNADYREFGIAGLNVCLFGFIPFAFGIVIAPLTDSWQRRAHRRAARRPPQHRRITLVRNAASLFLIVALAVLATGAAPPLALLLLLVMLRAGLTRALGRFESPADLFRRPALAVPAYAVILTPCLIGLAFTILSIERILS